MQPAFSPHLYTAPPSSCTTPPPSPSHSTSYTLAVVLWLPFTQHMGHLPLAIPPLPWVWTTNCVHFRFLWAAVGRHHAYLRTLLRFFPANFLTHPTPAYPYACRYRPHHNNAPACAAARHAAFTTVAPAALPASMATVPWQQRHLHLFGRTSHHSRMCSSLLLQALNTLPALINSFPVPTNDRLCCGAVERLWTVPMPLHYLTAITHTVIPPLWSAAPLSPTGFLPCILHLPAIVSGGGERAWRFSAGRAAAQPRLPNAPGCPACRLFRPCLARCHHHHSQLRIRIGCYHTVAPPPLFGPHDTF